jgi:hypothetical protein
LVLGCYFYVEPKVVIIENIMILDYAIVVPCDELFIYGETYCISRASPVAYDQTGQQKRIQAGWGNDLGSILFL